MLIGSVAASPRPTISFAAQGGVVVFVNRETPSDAEWAAYQNAIESEGQLHGLVRILVVTESGPPSPKQRQQAGELAARIKCRTAVVTDSVVQRTVVTVFSWFAIDIKAFSSARMHDALSFLALSSTQCDWCLATVTRLKAELSLC